MQADCSGLQLHPSGRGGQALVEAVAQHRRKFPPCRSGPVGPTPCSQAVGRGGRAYRGGRLATGPAADLPSSGRLTTRGVADLQDRGRRTTRGAAGALDSVPYDYFTRSGVFWPFQRCRTSFSRWNGDTCPFSAGRESGWS